MTDKHGYHIGSGIAWAGFWIMLGLTFLGANINDIEMPENISIFESKANK